MEELKLKLTDMAHGGTAVGHDENKRPIFVPFGIPGELVRVDVTQDKERFARAELKAVVRSSPSRVEPRCQHFGVCGGCHFQHMAYDSQLRAKQDVVRDQLKRIGGLKKVKVQPTLPNPQQWAYRLEMSFSPTADGGIGFWSPQLRQVMTIEHCEIMHPRLLEVWQDMDLALPGLRKLTLRVGADDEVLAAFEIDGVEPPDLEADFPVSVAIVLPDKTAASLIGNPYLTQQVRDREFRVSPGCYFPPSQSGAELLVDVVLAYANLTGDETVLDVYSGVGLLTTFLAAAAREVICVEVNGDAVADTAVNLDHTDNVSLYQGWAEEVLPALDIKPDLAVVNPTSDGLSSTVLNAILKMEPQRIVYVSSELSTLARDSKQMDRAGWQLVEVQPIDLRPQTYHVEVVALWQRGRKSRGAKNDGK